jgi:hypothetical protein
MHIYKNASNNRKYFVCARACVCIQGRENKFQGLSLMLHQAI